MDQDHTTDRFYGGRLVLKQPQNGYRAGGDPIFLAASIAPREGERVLDLGAGVGTAALCLLARCPTARVESLEIQPGLVALARLNAEGNPCAHALLIHHGDLQAPPLACSRESFDWVISNPPWGQAGSGTAPPDRSKALGHVEGDCDLASWLKAAQGFLKHKGTLAVIHRADRMDDLIAHLKRLKMGAIRLVPLYPRQGSSAIRVIVLARKGVRSPAELLPGLVLHETDGRFTAAAHAILELGQGLSL